MSLIPVQEPTILYVDDQTSHLSLFKKAFQADYLVLTTPSVEEGLEILKQHDIFLVIADHNMPRMTGVDFLEKARQASPQTQQAILSAYLNEEILKDARQRVSLLGHLEKPWKLDRMRGLVQEALKLHVVKQSQSLLEESLPTPNLDGIDIPWREIPAFLEKINGESLDARSAKRVFLNYVEPPLKNFVAPIQKPATPLVQSLQQEALKGNFDKIQKILGSYFKGNYLAIAFENAQKKTLN